MINDIRETLKDTKDIQKSKLPESALRISKAINMLVLVVWLLLIAGITLSAFFSVISGRSIKGLGFGDFMLFAIVFTIIPLLLTSTVLRITRFITLFFIRLFLWIKEGSQ